MRTFLCLLVLVAAAVLAQNEPDGPCNIEVFNYVEGMSYTATSNAGEKCACINFGEEVCDMTDTRNADILFLLDRTNSMQPILTQTANSLAIFAAGLQAANVDVRFAVFGYATAENCDTNNPGLVKYTDFTSDVAAASTALEQVMETLAGVECVSRRLDEAYTSIAQSEATNWRDDASRVVVIITDEDDDSPAAERTAAIQQSRADGVIFNIFADITSGNPDSADSADHFGEYIDAARDVNGDVITSTINGITVIEGTPYMGSNGENRVHGTVFDVNSLVSSNPQTIQGFVELFIDIKTREIRECVMPESDN